MKDITEKYAQGCGTNSIRYFVSPKTGSHTVVHYMAPGEGDYPEVYRFATVEEARVQWASLRKILQRRGYVRV